VAAGAAVLPLPCSLLLCNAIWWLRINPWLRCKVYVALKMLFAGFARHQRWNSVDIGSPQRNITLTKCRDRCKKSSLGLLCTLHQCLTVHTSLKVLFCLAISSEYRSHPNSFLQNHRSDHGFQGTSNTPNCLFNFRTPRLSGVYMQQGQQQRQQQCPAAVATAARYCCVDSEPFDVSSGSS
jgi:hypothetical protein